MRVLAIDGGGIRGLIPALVLAEIERRTGRRAAQLFDLIAGTSTGGILACALARPGDDGAPRFSAAQLAGLYTAEGPKIFHRSLKQIVCSVDGYLHARYDDGGLMDALRRYLGDARLASACADILVPAYDLRARSPFLFRASAARARPERDFALVDVARSTSAAPTYFQPFEATSAAGRAYPLIDGGVFATNPSGSVWTALVGAGRGADLELLVSLGTGSATEPIAFDKARGWGLIGWARPVIDVVFDGQADFVENEMNAMLAERYMRLQTNLREASRALDDASAANLAALRGEAQRLLDEHAADIDALCERLK